MIRETTSRRCEWCRGIESDDPEALCRGHLAEYEGLSESELDRMEHEQAVDLI